MKRHTFSEERVWPWWLDSTKLVSDKLGAAHSLAMTTRYAHLGDDQMKNAVAGLKITPFAAQSEMAEDEQQSKSSSSDERAQLHSI